MDLLNEIGQVFRAIWRTGRRWGRVSLSFALLWPILFMISVLLPQGVLTFIICSIPVIPIVLICFGTWNMIPRFIHVILISIGVWPLILFLINLLHIGVLTGIIAFLPFIAIAVILFLVWEIPDPDHVSDPANPTAPPPPHPWLRTVIAGIGCWQFMNVAVIFLEKQMFLTVVAYIPALTMVLLPVLFSDPMLGVVIGAFKYGQKILNGFGVWIGLELGIGVYFSLVPVDTIYSLIPVVILIILTLAFLSFGRDSTKTIGRLITLITIVLVVITVSFVFKKLFPSSAVFITMGGGTAKADTTFIKDETTSKADSLLFAKFKSWFTSPPPQKVLAANAANAATAVASQNKILSIPEDLRVIFVYPTSEYRLHEEENSVFLLHKENPTGWIFPPHNSSSLSFYLVSGDSAFVITETDTLKIYNGMNLKTNKFRLKGGGQGGERISVVVN